MLENTTAHAKNVSVIPRYLMSIMLLSLNKNASTTLITRIAHQPINIIFATISILLIVQCPAVLFKVTFVASLQYLTVPKLFWVRITYYSSFRGKLALGKHYTTKKISISPFY